MAKLNFYYTSRKVGPVFMLGTVAGVYAAFKTTEWFFRQSQLERLSDFRNHSQLFKNDGFIQEQQQNRSDD